VSYACGPALIIVGMLMLSPIRNREFEDLTDVIPVFTSIALMSFTYNFGIGMTAGFVLYPLVKTLAVRPKEVPAACRCCSLCSIRIESSTGTGSFTVLSRSFPPPACVPALDRCTQLSGY
jgi:xanthine/uracil/vitamin C permease (AzgA family)